jgi:uncharacterized damage-inducible protein DinB
MTFAYLQTMLDYHYWARDIILDAVTEVPRDKFTAPVTSSFGSLRDTVAHIYAADWIWFQRWTGQTPKTLIAYDQFPDPTSIRTAWKDLETSTRQFVDNLGEAGVNKAFSYTLLSGAPDTAPFWEMLVHVVNHATYHRGQVTTLMRQMGMHPPKPTDMIAFFRTRR